MCYWFHQSFYMAKAFPFIGGWLADRLLGDPEGWPHPVVGFGKVISLGEKTLNKGNDRAVKGGIMALILVVGTYLLCERILALAGHFHPIVASILSGIGVFYCLAGKTLVKEVKAVFEAVDRSTEEGRKQVGRIVGRDTSRLSPQEIRAAALETLAENQDQALWRISHHIHSNIHHCAHCTGYNSYHHYHKPYCIIRQCNG